MADENINKSSIGANGDESNLQFADIWALIWNNIIWYALCIGFCLVVACFYIYRTPKTYSRQAKVIIEEDENSSLRDLSSFVGTATRYRSSGTNVYNEIEYFTSPDLMQRVVERLGLETNYYDKQFFRTRELYSNSPISISLAGGNPTSYFSFNIYKNGKDAFDIKDFVLGPYGDKIKFKKVTGHFGDTISTPAGRLVVNPTSHIGNWKREISVSWVNSMSRAKSCIVNLSSSLSNKESSVVVLSLKDLFPDRASAIISTLIDVYNEEWINNKNRSARNTTQFINDRLVVIQNELGGVETNLKNYKEKNKITDIKSVSDAFLKQSSDYSSKYFEINNQYAVAKYIRDYLNEPAHAKSLIPANSGISNATVEDQIKQYNDLVLRRDMYQNESSSSNPMVEDLNDAIASMRSAIIRSVDNLIATLRLQLDRISNQEDNVMGKISSSSGQELELLSIERQQKVKEQLYIYLLQKREENEIQSLVNVGNTRLIMNPNGSPSPVAPKKSMILLVALIIGFGIPFVIFYMIKTLSTSVKAKSDITNVSVPFLAEIPQMGITGNWLERMRADRFNKDYERILVQGGKRDMINEAFRVLRTNLDLMLNVTPGCHKVMMTSFNPNAGKTFVTMNMAASVALKGSKVLLLDLDLRKATLSKALKLNREGFIGYLNGKELDYHNTLKEVVENLYLMPVGTLPPNPAELLLSEKFVSLLDSLTKEFDYIFMDCPPVDIVSDTGIIAKYADMTVFVMRSGLFDKRALPSVEELYQDGTYNKMAILLNGVEGNGRGYGYGKYGYGYGGKYGYGYSHSYGYGYGHSYGYGSGYGYGYGYGEQDDDDNVNDTASEAKSKKGKKA
jgi:tyrosine-protein kinase Etk/Wzc